MASAIHMSAKAMIKHISMMAVALLHCEIAALPILLVRGCHELLAWMLEAAAEIMCIATTLMMYSLFCFMSGNPQVGRRPPPTGATTCFFFLPPPMDDGVV